MKVLAYILGFLVLRAIYYSYYLHLSIRYENYFKDYLTKEDATPITQYKSQIRQLMRVAGIKDRYLPIVKPMGYGQLASMNVSVVDNIANLQEDVVQTNLIMFDEAKGNLRYKITQTINPIYWLDVALSLLPKMFIYIGVKPDSVFIKLAQVVWWLVVATSVVTGIFFNKEFTSWVTTIL